MWGGPVLARLAFNSSSVEATVADFIPKTCDLTYAQNRNTLGGESGGGGDDFFLVRIPMGHGASTTDGGIETHALGLAQTRHRVTVVAMHTAVTNECAV